ncbi:MAG: Response regulator rcp1 [Gemmatimonadaceae bacterium]|nr:Response regulator rcp1 [Gemmatimonadaceae bacterium]
MRDKAILLVEDNSSDVDLTRRALEKRRIGNDLVVVEDGQEALDYLFAQGPYAHRDPTDLPSVVLLDINLPKVDGLSVLRRIRENALTALLPVIMLTTSQEEQDLLASYRLHANSYIRKPVDFLQFVDAVGQLGMYWLVLNESAPAAR